MSRGDGGVIFHTDGYITMWDDYRRKQVYLSDAAVCNDSYLMEQLSIRCRARIEARAYGRTLADAKALVKVIRSQEYNRDDGITLDAEPYQSILSLPYMNSKAIIQIAGCYHASVLLDSPKNINLFSFG